MLPRCDPDPTGLGKGGSSQRRGPQESHGLSAVGLAPLDPPYRRAEGRAAEFSLTSLPFAKGTT